MQFSLAAGSESAASDRKNTSDPIMTKQVFKFSPHVKLTHTPMPSMKAG